MTTNAHPLTTAAPQSPTLDRLLTIDEARERLKVSRAFILHRTCESCPEEDRIPGMIKLSRKNIRFRESVFERWIANGCKPLSKENKPRKN